MRRGAAVALPAVAAPPRPAAAAATPKPLSTSFAPAPDWQRNARQSPQPTGGRAFLPLPWSTSSSLPVPIYQRSGAWRISSRRRESRPTTETGTLATPILAAGLLLFQLKGREAVGGHNFVTSGWVSEPRMKQVAADSGIIMTQPQVEVWFLGKGDGEILAAHGLKRRGYSLRAREERSCTDGSKSWFPPAMKKLEVRPVAEMGLSSSAMKKRRIDTATSATCAPQP
ncbi:hypothetical protein HPB52_015968 [Rhipicephalus sanguineus]|uniref:Uncharacterized protein n=1 Tax=Rhipicephalus sanguineus TaxID=34632 RepID=A0A9D4Q0T8_RHISA|nr:hypothetical protein HPB52_015968 [Rhipicephalus sanguineus]